jgi:hypothetical protein
MVRALSSNHRLPDNPRWIEFTRTDGVEARRPTSTEFNPDSDNNVNYMRPVPLTEGFSIGWRLAFGKALASKLGYEGMVPSRLLMNMCPNQCNQRVRIGYLEIGLKIMACSIITRAQSKNHDMTRTSSVSRLGCLMITISQRSA